MPKLLIENGVDRGKSFIIKKDEPFFAGRDQAAQIVITDEMASRRHFQIEHRDDRYFLRDLESSNGTFLNGSLVRKVEALAPNDRIQVGSTLISFQDDKPHPLIGREISGYRILDRIGRGGMGTVYRALQTSLDRVVALKVLAPHLVKNTNFVNLFIREARAAGALSHPNVVQVYDVGVHEDIYFFSMEYIPDGSVEDLLNRSGPIPLTRALRMVHDAAQGLQYAEQVGIIHRDIKPGNLMIGAGSVVKIGDLGISRSTEGERQASQKDGVSGSPHYIAPEQAKGYDIDSRVDIYSLGCSFYQMLSGTTPFRGSTPREVILKHLKEPPPPLLERVEGLPSDVSRLVHHMMEKSPAERVRNAAELIELLTPLMRKYPDDGAGVIGASSSLGWGRMIAIGTTIVALVGVGVAGVYVKHQADQQTLAEEERQGRVENAISTLRTQVDDADLEAAAATLDGLVRDDFQDEEWAVVDELRVQYEALRAEEDRLARIEAARVALDELQQSAEARLAELKPQPWRDRHALLETLAAELEAFVRENEALAQEGKPLPILVTARSRAETLRGEANALEEHEERALEELERLRPIAEGKAAGGDYLAARGVLEQFDAERYAGTAAEAQRQDALSTLRGHEAEAWETLELNIDELLEQDKLTAALLRLQNFEARVTFDAQRTKVAARIAAVEEKLQASSDSGTDRNDASVATAAIRAAWAGWADDLVVSDDELRSLRDTRFQVQEATVSARIERHSDLLEEWREVRAGFDGRKVDRITLGLAKGDVRVRDLRIDGNKIRYQVRGGSSDFCRWGELSVSGRVELLIRLAETPIEHLFAGLLARWVGDPAPAGGTAWEKAQNESALGSRRETAREALSSLEASESSPRNGG